MDESHNTPSKPASEGTLMASIMNPAQPNQITTYEEAMDSLEEGSVVRTSSPKKDRYAEHDLDLSRQLSEMNAYVNDYNSKLDLKTQNSSRTDKLKLKINLGKIKEKEAELASDRNFQVIEELKKENARLIDRQAKEIK